MNKIMKKMTTFNTSKFNMKDISVDMDLYKTDKVSFISKLEKDICEKYSLKGLQLSFSEYLPSPSKSGFTEISSPHQIPKYRFIISNVRDMIHISIVGMNDFDCLIPSNTAIMLEDMFVSVLSIKYGNGDYVYKGGKKTRIKRYNTIRHIFVFDFYEVSDDTKYSF